MSSKFLQESSSIINVWQNSKWDKVFMGKVNFFKDCLPQISFRPFLNTLSHLEFYQTSMMEELKNYRAFFVTFFCSKEIFLTFVFYLKYGVLNKFWILITVLAVIWDSYMSWSTRFVSVKLDVGFPIFNSVLFLLKFIFLFNKRHILFNFKTS